MSESVFLLHHYGCQAEMCLNANDDDISVVFASLFGSSTFTGSCFESSDTGSV